MERNCLRCDKPFESRGSSNRICGSCSYQNRGTQNADCLFPNVSEAVSARFSTGGKENQRKAFKKRNSGSAVRNENRKTKKSGAISRKKGKKK